jgi:glycosyltransferase involved in cell wall biosynthesis
MNILIIVDVYPPEISSAAHLMRDLAEGLNKRGHNVSVATTKPKYYLKEKEKSNFKEVEYVNGVKVIRVSAPPLHKTNFIVRGISQLLLPFIFTSKIKKNIDKPLDAVFVYSPPLTLGLAGGMIKKKYNAKFILNLQDIFPQNAIDLGIFKNPVLVKFFEWIEKKVYKTADFITFHSEGGRKWLIENKNVPSQKIITLPNWINSEPFRNIKEPISFRKKYNLENKFVFLFPGIMGPAQGLDFLIETARRVSDNKDIVFLLVGDGMKKESLKKLVKDYDLDNVIFKPFVSQPEFPSLVKSFDVGIVCLSKKNKTPFVPGKLLSYLAAGKPILAFLNKESDAFSLIEKARCGYALTAGEEDKAEEAVRHIYREKDSLENLGKNGYNFFLQNFTLESALDKIEEILTDNS